MVRKLGGFILLAFALPGPALAEGRFCVVTNHGESCYHYDANRCREEAARQGGMCVLNENKRANTSVLDGMNSIREAGERGRRAGMEQREHNARVQLLEAQIATETESVSRGTRSGSAAPANAVTDGKSLHRACGYAQALNGPAGDNFSEDDSFMAALCLMYSAGAYEAAVLAGGFSSADSSVQFCAPKATSNGMDLVSAIVTAGNKAPPLVADGADTAGLLLLALVSMSSCPPIVK